MKRLVVGNIKMNLLYPRERDQYIANLKNESRRHVFSQTDIVLCPPFLYIEAFLKNSPKNVSIGAQNVFWERKGAYTGEISPIMLKEMGCMWSIIGHSERRMYLDENNETVQKKVFLAVESGINVILCVGETLEERRGEKAHIILEKQISSALNGITGSKLKNIVIAYEPLWSIGTDITPTSNEIMEAGLLIKRTISILFGRGSEKEIAVLYGGSVYSKNVHSVCLEPSMDGVLVGRESLHIDELFRIADIIDQSSS